jgi:hippurate hydrolase
MPIITLKPESLGVTSNDPGLTRRLAGQFLKWFGAERFRPSERVTSAEDFSEYSRTEERVPTCLWWVGSTDPAKFVESEPTGIPVPSNHSSTFAPVPEPTLKTCVTSMSAAVLELMGNSQSERSKP